MISHEQEIKIKISDIFLIAISGARAMLCYRWAFFYHFDNIIDGLN